MPLKGRYGGDFERAGIDGDGEAGASGLLRRIGDLNLEIKCTHSCGGAGDNAGGADGQAGRQSLTNAPLVGWRTIGCREGLRIEKPDSTLRKAAGNNGESGLAG